MKKNLLKPALTAAVFLTLLFGLLLAHLLLPDKAVSVAERRKLAQLPAFSGQAVRDGTYQQEMETYLLDQFPLRDAWRSVKAALRFYVYGQKDNNGVYLVDGSVQKLEAALDEKQIAYGAKKINAVTADFLSGMNVYYAVIPDKNYFVAESNGYPHMDYAALVSLLKEQVTGAQYVDLFDCLEIGDYYATDAHWRQEKLDRVLGRLCGALDIPAPDLSAFEPHALSPFYGVYCGQSALPVGADTLVYLTSPATESAQVYSAEYEGARPVYTVDRFEGMDGYDVYLSGAQALLTIESPQASTDRQLYLFRDSFGSSIAPLLTGVYRKITLIDLRYVPAQALPQFMTFESENADALFLYSTSILNSAMLLR